MFEIVPADQQLRFGVLGPVTVWHGDREIAVGLGHERVLLAVLMARAGGLAAMSDLEQALWEGASPRTATNMIHRYVSLLRRRLEPALPTRSGGRFIVRDGAGYRLLAGPDNLDLLDFRARAARGRELAEAGEHVAALDRFLEALGRWRGRAGAGLGATAQSWPGFVALEHQYMTVARDAADSALRSGGAQRVLPAVREASARSPLDEALHARLLLTLAADGKQAEAVKVYGELRTRLTRELGIDPGPELRAAFRSVLRGGGTPAPPPGSGAAAPASPDRPAQLPSDLRMFVGRADELREGARLLRRRSVAVPVVAYDGVGGVGKTTFVVHLAHRLTADFPDGLLYANLRSAGAGADPGRVLADLLTALGMASHRLPPGLDARGALYRSALAGRRTLIVLDDASDAAQIRPLLPGAGGNAVLVTSHGRLSGLATVHGADLRTLYRPEPAEARACIEARLGTPRTSAERAALDEIVDRCGRLPLALAIVAVRGRSDPRHSLISIAADLRPGAGALAAVPAGPLDRGLRSVFDWSYRLTSAGAAGMLRSLPHHGPGDITAESAAALAGLPVDEARSHLVELLRARLLNRHRPGRYGLHELVAGYARELGQPAPPARR
ncbi:MAG: BTAD domain-containing putative transcriptional regulator [Actinoplanes sp.]